MVNMDMVGRLRDNELTIYGTGSSPMMNEILEQANERQQFKLFQGGDRIRPQRPPVVL